jgi:hypothetical protein
VGTGSLSQERAKYSKRLERVNSAPPPGKVHGACPYVPPYVPLLLYGSTYLSTSDTFTGEIVILMISTKKTNDGFYFHVEQLLIDLYVHYLLF